jgi:hypothetical protein
MTYKNADRNLISGIGSSTADALFPFWSPDGTALAFSHARKLLLMDHDCEHNSEAPGVESACFCPEAKRRQ